VWYDLICIKMLLNLNQQLFILVLPLPLLRWPQMSIQDAGKDVQGCYVQPEIHFCKLHSRPQKTCARFSFITGGEATDGEPRFIWKVAVKTVVAGIP